MPFDNLLQLAAESENKPITEFAAKHPELKTFFDLGEQVHQLSPRLKTLGYDGKPEGVVTELERWRGWLSDEQKGWKWHEADKARLQNALAESMTRVAELEATEGADMTADEIKVVVKEVLKEAGVVTNPDLEAQFSKMITDKVQPMVESRVNGVGAVWEDVSKTLLPKMSAHERKFGEPIDMDKIYNTMRDHQKTTGQYLKPLDAYNQVYHDQITAKAHEQTEAEKKAEYDKGVLEGRKAAAATSGRANPVDGKGSSAPTGALQSRWQAKQEKLKNEGGDPKLGDRRIATEAAREFREKEAAAGGM